jgi:hypothetical protein
VRIAGFKKGIGAAQSKIIYFINPLFIYAVASPVKVKERLDSFRSHDI